MTFGTPVYKMTHPNFAAAATTHLIFKWSHLPKTPTPNAKLRNKVALSSLYRRCLTAKIEIHRDSC